MLPIAGVVIVGSGLTVIVTSLTLVPQEGVWLLVTVRRSVIVPEPDPLVLIVGVVVLPSTI